MYITNYIKFVLHLLYFTFSWSLRKLISIAYYVLPSLLSIHGKLILHQQVWVCLIFCTHIIDPDQSNISTNRNWLFRIFLFVGAVNDIEKVMSFSIKEVRLGPSGPWHHLHFLKINYSILRKLNRNELEIVWYSHNQKELLLYYVSTCTCNYEKGEKHSTPGFLNFSRSWRHALQVKWSAIYVLWRLGDLWYIYTRKHAKHGRLLSLDGLNLEPIQLTSSTGFKRLLVVDSPLTIYGGVFRNVLLSLAICQYSFFVWKFD